MCDWAADWPRRVSLQTPTEVKNSSLLTS